MPDKLQAYEQMSSDTAVRITSSYLEWTGFLGAVGTLYNKPLKSRDFMTN